MKWDRYKLHQLLGASNPELLDGLCGAPFLEFLLVMQLAALDDLVAESRVGKQFSLRVGLGM